MRADVHEIRPLNQVETRLLAALLEMQLQLWNVDMSNSWGFDGIAEGIARKLGIQLERDESQKIESEWYRVRRISELFPRGPQGEKQEFYQ